MSKTRDATSRNALPPGIGAQKKCPAYLQSPDEDPRIVRLTRTLHLAVEGVG